ncbi:MAG: hypothetical protein COX89_01050 [Candidatus Nealsonbacteria bacterium CG_4_10_14_0_2_um_filter_37_10]|uniref:Uncharacterized protein n=1 Tax=Candidatus Nealsonbacteria bacterium CG_4_10_14_0_2_um_filter_37_10 TaxID=1974679 RepID=A0A2M7V008_9BACT|nr:MAG: hypothetical protein COX89_01050 [Candidatus Nealsonbacteria bacterium CG_4_10_14_0_2_um_filter_37_10]
MATKIFNGKKITIRKISKNDLRNVKKFQDFINSFVKEDLIETVGSYQGVIVFMDIYADY